MSFRFPMKCVNNSPSPYMEMTRIFTLLLRLDEKLSANCLPANVKLASGQIDSFMNRQTDSQAEVLGFFTPPFPVAESYLCSSPVGGSSKLGKHIGCF